MDADELDETDSGWGSAVDSGYPAGTAAGAATARTGAASQLWCKQSRLDAGAGVQLLATQPLQISAAAWLPPGAPHGFDPNPSS